MPEPKFFSTQNHFREWLEKNHSKEPELLVGFYKVGSGKPSMTWSESVDQALCFGWIDGVRRRVGDEAYTIRFSPRRPGSVWSAINLKKVESLTKDGLMRPAGLEAFENRDAKKSGIYAYENRPKKLDTDLEMRFKKESSAWNYFAKQPPSYKRLCIFFVMSAKQEKTRISRLEKLILVSKAGQRLL